MQTQQRKWNSNVEETLPCSVSVPGVKKSCDNSQYIWWDSQQESLNVTLVQSGHNSWEKIGDRSGCNKPENKKHKYISLYV